jgi:hypothetical protein
MPVLRSFEEICRRTDPEHRSVLVANGFSIACTQSFDYRRLLDEADFGGTARDKRVRKLFERAETADFETVVRRLEEAAVTVGLYSTERVVRRMTHDADVIRHGLAGALAEVHTRRIGDVGDARLDRCNRFLQNFREVYTLNYDALLHWARMRDPGPFDDGFRRRDDRVVHDAPEQQTIFWLHGALHLREEGWLGDTPATVKATWAEDGPLIDYVRDAIEDGRYPLIVTEGTWKQKRHAIRRSPYLSCCFESLQNAAGDLVTYGWGMNPNDDHILSAIAGSRIATLYLGVRAGTAGVKLAEAKAAGDVLRARSGNRFTVRLWDTSTAAVW